MRFTFFYLSFILISNQCSHKATSDSDPSSESTYAYYSDYFVFIADDAEGPLVVPIDINWNPSDDGYEVEYKSWYGTERDWPIEYLKKNIKGKKSDIPGEAFDHQDTEVYDFDPVNGSITAKINGAPEIKIQIPEKAQWVLPPLESDFPTFAFKTSVQIGEDKRSGWMMYERIRLLPLSREFDGFAAFYWMPFVVEGNLYHLTQHRGKQTAVKWSVDSDTIEVETVAGFAFELVDTVSDSKSKRTSIVKTVRLQVPQWDLDITLKSTGQQVGYGEEFPKGLAYFRQSLLQSIPKSNDQGYGMMELILADD